MKDSRNPLFTEGTQAWDAFYDDGYPNVVLDPASGNYRAWYTSYQGPSISGFFPAKEGYQQMVNYRESAVRSPSNPEIYGRTVFSETDFTSNQSQNKVRS